MPKLSLAVLPYMQAQHFVECDSIPGARTLSIPPSIRIVLRDERARRHLQALHRSLAFGRFVFVGSSRGKTDADSCGRLISDPFSLSFREIFNAIRLAGQLAGCRAMSIN